MSRTVDEHVDPEIFEGMRLELRRGALVLAVLAQLRTEQYGYTLRRALAESGIEIDEGTLYPLLRRLETHRLLSSEWREEAKRNKRFYRITPTGEVMLGRLRAEWEGIQAGVARAFGEKHQQQYEPDQAIRTRG